MSTTKQHLTEFHEAAASHHLAMAKSHKKLAALFGKTESDHDKTLCEEHKAMSASHTTMGEFHTKCAKAIGVEDLSKADQLVPDKVSAVITGFRKPFRVRVNGRSIRPRKMCRLNFVHWSRSKRTEQCSHPRRVLPSQLRCGRTSCRPSTKCTNSQAAPSLCRFSPFLLN